ncbi:hypothetical protein ACYPKM_03270 [Pseudomonas aeruginosa]
MSTHQSNPEGVGLLVARNVGQRVLFRAREDATDEEILQALEDGLTVKLHDVANFMRSSSASRTGTQESWWANVGFLLPKGLKLDVMKKPQAANNDISRAFS